MLAGAAAWVWLAATPPVQQPFQVEQRWMISNRDVSRYEGLYGIPIYWSLSLIVGPTGQEPPPPMTSIRTRGVLSAFPKQGSSVPDVKLCEDTMRYCLALDNPAPEIREDFLFGAPLRNGQEAQVVGAFDHGFLFWSVDSGERAEPAARAAPDRSLEQIVTRPDRVVGTTVTVRGHFRGANLFADFPAETRRDKGDWVLREGPFSLWVTGQRPEGSGWRLDIASPLDCVWRVEVEGRIERHGDASYLKARRVRLLDRDPDSSCARAAAP
jgi:hypothetical protein